MSVGVSPGSTVGLNLRTPLYIGGVSRDVRVAPSVEVDFHQGFQGCISQVRYHSNEQFYLSDCPQR